MNATILEEIDEHWPECDCYNAADILKRAAKYIRELEAANAEHKRTTFHAGMCAGEEIIKIGKQLEQERAAREKAEKELAELKPKLARYQKINKAHPIEVSNDELPPHLRALCEEDEEIPIK